jgi:hypothetical protein
MAVLGQNAAAMTGRAYLVLGVFGSSVAEGVYCSFTIEC